MLFKSASCPPRASRNLIIRVQIRTGLEHYFNKDFRAHFSCKIMKCSNLQMLMRVNYNSHSLRYLMIPDRFQGKSR